MDKRHLILLVGLVAQNAAAFDETPGFLSVAQTSAATVEVRSTNGELYNEVKSGSQVVLKAEGACEIEPNGNKHYVKTLTFTATVWPGMESPSDLQSLDHFPNHLPQMQVQFPEGIYPDGVSYPAGWRERAIAACNVNLNHQIDNKGLTKNQALGKVWNLKNVPLDTLTGKLVCGPAPEGGGFTDPGKIHEDSVAATMNVRCLKYSLDQVSATPNEPDPPGATDNVTNKVGVTQAVVTMVPDQYQGVCPAQLNASLTIVTNGPTRVRYQLESDKGQKSSPRYINVDQTNTAYVSVRIPVGKAVAVSSSGNYGVTSAGGGGGNPGGSITSTAGPANVYQGFYRLLTLAPNEVSSAPSSFKVTCKPAQNQQLAVPTNSQPQAPLPAVQKMRTTPPTQQSGTQKKTPPSTPQPSSTKKATTSQPSDKK